jgi:dienelactone hydrolase
MGEMNPSKAVRLVAALLGVVLILLPIPAIAASPRVPSIEIKPKQAFIDERVKIILQDFPAKQLVTVRVRSTNGLGQIWESHAEFLSDRHGRVDLTTQAPISGTYRHADAAGLFWSMSLPAGETVKLDPARKIQKTAIFQIAADVNGQAVAAANLQRLFVAPGVERIPVHDGVVRGTFFVPSGKGPHPGIIVLGGSEGGLSELNASFLATKGYAALALAYFNYEDLPQTLENIPLEYFEAGINWLQLRKEVRNHEIAVIGSSRGGELALLLGSTFRQIKAVVAIAPSGVRWAGVEDPRQAAWTYQGRPLPFMGTQDLTPDQQKQAGKILQTTPLSLTPLLQMQMENRAAVEKASIPVEKINGPILLISGKDDQLWPSTILADMVMERLKRAKHRFPDRHLAYEGAGHYIPIPNLPATVNKLGDPNTKTEIALGGDPEHTAAAGADAWARIVKFLHTTFIR